MIYYLFIIMLIGTRNEKTDELVELILQHTYATTNLYRSRTYSYIHIFINPQYTIIIHSANTYGPGTTLTPFKTLYKITFSLASDVSTTPFSESQTRAGHRSSTSSPVHIV